MRKIATFFLFLFVFLIDFFKTEKRQSYDEELKAQMYRETNIAIAYDISLDECEKISTSDGSSNDDMLAYEYQCRCGDYFYFEIENPNLNVNNNNNLNKSIIVSCETCCLNCKINM